jgi:hypothetical protein
MISILFDNSRLFDLSGSSLTESKDSVRLNPSRIKEMDPYRKNKAVKHFFSFYITCIR